MKYVVVDLEMNPVSAEYRKIHDTGNMEIIEIGAVALDDSYSEIDSFYTYIKPSFNSVIEKKYERLTGITTSMVENAPDFENALNMFIKWCENLNDEIQFCQWSESDLMQIKKEIVMKQYITTDREDFLLSEWCDFQHEFGELLGIEKKISLKEALMYAGIDFEGRQHDALYDARNTAVLLATARDEENRKEHFDKIIAAMKPKSENSFTLGDVFDFSKIVFN